MLYFVAYIFILENIKLTLKKEINKKSDDSYYIKVNNAIALRIEKSLENKMGNRIDFVNAILKNEK